MQESSIGIRVSVECSTTTTALRREGFDRVFGHYGQIAFALKQAELGTPVEEVCRKMGISDATLYNWRKKYGGLGPSERGD